MPRFTMDMIFTGKPNGPALRAPRLTVQGKMVVDALGLEPRTR